MKLSPPFVRVTRRTPCPTDANTFLSGHAHGLALTPQAMPHPCSAAARYGAHLIASRRPWEEVQGPCVLLVASHARRVPLSCYGTQSSFWGSLWSYVVLEGPSTKTSRSPQSWMWARPTWFSFPGLQTLKKNDKEGETIWRLTFTSPAHFPFWYLEVSFQ